MRAWDTGQGERNPVLESLLPFFAGKCITTNLVEGTFSSSKKLVEFRGRRDVETWKEILHAFFPMHWDASILEEALESLDLNSQTRDRMLNRFNLSFERQVAEPRR